MTPAFDTGHWIVAFDPIAIDLGFLQIRWYALSYIAGLVLGWQYINLLLRTDRLWAQKDRANFPRDTRPLTLPGGVRLTLPRLSFGPQVRKTHDVRPPARTAHIDDLLVWATLGVILGGRLGYVLFYGLIDNPEAYFENPLRIFMLWEGGMSFHGGLLGVVLAIVFFSRRNGLDMIRVGDLVAVATPIGLFFGRLANFINGELWGKVTDAPWGVIFMTEVARDAAQGIVKPAEAYVRHPSQLYEGVLEGLVLFVLLVWAVRRFHILDRPGLATGLFLAGYGAARTTVEFFREAEEAFIPGHWFTMGMALSLPMILLGGAIVWKAMRGTPPVPKPLPQG